MNERIKKMISESIKAIPDHVDFDVPDEFINKFDELIVKECIKDCRDMFVVDCVSWNLLNEKLEHFGVEK